MPRAWHRSFQNAFLAICYLIAHFLIVLVLIGLITVIQWILVRDGDPRVFDICPWRYIFDAMEVAVVMVFLVFGTREAIRVFRENERRENERA
jgi:hypothetical protein